MYGKHFESMYTGSMFGGGFALFAVWGYVISHVQGGVVELNPSLLAALFGESQQNIVAVLATLCEPDAESRSKDHEGRRLIRTGQFSYNVVNAEYYQRIRNEQERREYKKKWDRENRPSGHKREKSDGKSDKTRQNPTNPTHTDSDEDRNEDEETEAETTSFRNRKARALDLSSSVRFAAALEKAIPPHSKSDRTALLHVTQWLMVEIKECRRDDNVFQEVLDIAASVKTAQKPIAAFFAKLRQDVGYNAKAEAQKAKAR